MLVNPRDPPRSRHAGTGGPALDFQVVNGYVQVIVPRISMHGVVRVVRRQR